MRLKCLSDLDEYQITRTKKTFKRIKTKEYYTLEEACEVCGHPYMKSRKSNTNCCSLSCAQAGFRNHEFGKTKELNQWYNKKHTKASLKKISLASKGKNNPSWKGGVIKNNLPLYDTYANKLNFIEKVRPKIENNIKLLEVKCKKCNKWHVPSRVEVRHRLQALDDVHNHKESNFYCSEDCKKKCTIYRSSGSTKEMKDNYGLKIWSKEVLKRAEYKCEICEATAKVAHHIKPKKLEPNLALDPDNGIALCLKCHYKYGHQNDCSFNSLARITCSNIG